MNSASARCEPFQVPSSERAVGLVFALRSPTAAAVGRDSGATETAPHRMIVLSDIEDEPDDTESFVRLLLYSNDIDLKGLVATTSTWKRTSVAPDSIRAIIHAYAKVQPNLLKHDARYPAPDALQALVKQGRAEYGMDGVGDGKDSEGSDWIIRILERTTTARCGSRSGAAPTRSRRRSTSCAPPHRRGGRSPGRQAAGLHDLRSGRQRPVDPEEFPEALLHRDSRAATTAPPRGRRSTRGRPGIDNTTDQQPLARGTHPARSRAAGRRLSGCGLGDGGRHAVLARADSQRPERSGASRLGRLGRTLRALSAGVPRHRPEDISSAAFPIPAGDAPDLDQRRRRLHAARPSANTGGQPSRAKSHSQDFKVTLWRWRDDFQNDFAARMDWTTRSYADANHPPVPVLDHPDAFTVRSGEDFGLDAHGPHDPDGDSLSFYWFPYPEAGTYEGSAEDQRAGKRGGRRVTAPKVDKPGDRSLHPQGHRQGQPAAVALQARSS